MKPTTIIDTSYNQWVEQLSLRYRQCQIKAVVRVLRKMLPNVEGLSERSIRYMKSFYTLYSQRIENLPQLVAELVCIQCILANPSVSINAETEIEAYIG